jgi:UDP-2,3-diacylglucosamine hydrolase
LRTDPSPAVLFISDLHLSPAQPAVQDCFLAFLEDQARTARALYILGDLFDAWLGDDDLASPWPATLAAELRRLGEFGVDLFVMHGNRDFLLGERFLAATGAHLLPDPTSIDLHGIPTLLSHGDALCTDDLAYQHFRTLVRDPDWRRAFLAKPLAERRVLAAQLREQSETAKAGKTMASMDVNLETVRDLLRRHGCHRLIHGHTHLPARHDLHLDGHAGERWVLPDWHARAGGYLRCAEDGCQLVSLACAPDRTA